MNDRNNSYQTNTHEAIAIVGISARFAKANDILSYWDIFVSHKDVLSDISASRWPKEFFDPAFALRINSKRAGLLDQIDEFSPDIFNITPSEAVIMDPQQRFLLEESYKAFWDSGQNPFELKGQSIGVYVGVGFSDYLITRSDDSRLYSGKAATGSSTASASGRISYIYGLEGPSLAIDTACSSAFTAIDCGVKALQRGDICQALVGAVGMLVNPIMSLPLSQANMLSFDGKCRSFDAAASGYVRAEGGGFFVLKRLSDAEQAGDRIYGVILASAVNQDGASNGLSSPRKEAQIAVYQKALAASGLSTNNISYIETHGTGTPVGDPIEFASLKTVYAQHTRNTPLIIAASKSNIGHAEEAAGIAALLKALFVLKTGNCPAINNIEAVNPNIEETANIKIATDDHQLPRIANQPRACGVSAFGFTGTNTHLIVQEYIDDNQQFQLSKHWQKAQQTLLTSELRDSYWMPFSQQLLDTKSRKHGNTPTNQPQFDSVLGEKLTLASDNIIFQKRIKPESLGLLKDHCVNDKIVFPAAGYLDMALKAAMFILQSPTINVQQLKCVKPLIIEKTAVLVQTIVKKLYDCIEVSIVSLSDEEKWIEHAIARVDKKPCDVSCLKKFDIEAIETTFIEKGQWDAKTIYQFLDKSGLCYNNDFHKNRWTKKYQEKTTGEIILLSKIEFDDALKKQTDHILYPPLADICFQTALFTIVPFWHTLLTRDVVTKETLHLPVSLNDVKIYKQARGKLFYCIVSNLDNNTTLTIAKKFSQQKIALYDENGELLSEIANMGTAKYNPSFFHLANEINPLASLYNAYLKQETIAISELECMELAIVGGSTELTKTIIDVLKTTGVTLAFYDNILAYYDDLANNPKTFLNLLDLSHLDATSDQDTLAILKRYYQYYQQMIMNDYSDIRNIHVFFSGTSMPSMDMLNHSPVKGMLRTINREDHNLKIAIVNLSASSSECEVTNKLRQRRLIEQILAEIHQRFNLAWDKKIPFEIQINGEVKTYKKLRLNSNEASMERYRLIQSKNFRIGPAKFGHYESIDVRGWYDTMRPIAANEVFVEVSHIGLNYKDVLFCQGSLRDFVKSTYGVEHASEHPIGLEYAGKIVEVGKNVEHLHVGDSVFGSHGSFIGKLTRFDAAFVHKIPKSISNAQAASLPIAFCTVIYGLKHLAKLSANHSVLIHTAAGGVGQVGVAYVQSIGAKLLVSCSHAKRAFVSAMGINDEQIIDSRDPDFAQQVMQKTNGHGVDIILNTLGAQKTRENIKCLSAGGTLVELGKLGLLSTEEVKQERGDIHYHSFDLQSAITDHTIYNQLMDELANYYQKTHHIPYFTQWQLADIALAFHQLESGSSVGKYVVRLPEKSDFQAPIVAKPSGQYIITGGAGYLGQHAAKFLATQADTTIHLLGRRQRNSDIEAILQTLNHEFQQSQFVYHAVDISDTNALSDWIKTISADNIKGVIHTAGIVKNNSFVNESWDNFADACTPKVIGTMNLYHALRNSQLDFFVSYSSTSSTIGNPGQSAYVAANIFLDEFSAYLRKNGTTVFTINWGAWEGGGMSNTIPGAIRKKMADIGLEYINAELGNNTLNMLPYFATDNFISSNINQKNIKKEGMLAFEIFDDITSGISQSEATLNFLRALSACQDPQEATQLIETQLIELTSQLTGIAKNKISPSSVFYDLGIDSVMTLNFRIQLETLTKTEIPNTIIFDYPSIEKLALYLLSELDGNAESHDNTTVTNTDSSNVVTKARNTETDMIDLMKTYNHKVSQSVGKFSPKCLPLARGDIKQFKRYLLRTSDDELAIEQISDAICQFSHNLLYLNGHVIEYYLLGKAISDIKTDTPIIIIMPPLGADIHTLLDYALGLANQCTVLYISPPGHGLSHFEDVPFDNVDFLRGTMDYLAIADNPVFFSAHSISIVRAIAFLEKYNHSYKIVGLISQGILPYLEVETQEKYLAKANRQKAIVEQKANHDSYQLFLTSFNGLSTALNNRQHLANRSWETCCYTGHQLIIIDDADDFIDKTRTQIMLASYDSLRQYRPDLSIDIQQTKDEGHFPYVADPQKYIDLTINFVHQVINQTNPTPAKNPCIVTPITEDKPQVAIFPGQGSQAKGMGETLFDVFTKQVAIADDILGYSIKELCLQGSETMLSQTNYTQPAIFVVSCLHYDYLNACGLRPKMVLGHSSGEVAAMYAAGIVSFANGLRLVKKRGELMSQASAGSMFAIIGMEKTKIIATIDSENCENVCLANINSPQQIVISGATKEVTKVARKLERQGAKKVIKLPVSGAFHSPLMADAVNKFIGFLETIKFDKPQIPIMSCNNHCFYPDDEQQIRELVGTQLITPVDWVTMIKCVREKLQDDIAFFECGHGDILTRLIAEGDAPS